MIFDRCRFAKILAVPILTFAAVLLYRVQATAEEFPALFAAHQRALSEADQQCDLIYQGMIDRDFDSSHTNVDRVDWHLLPDGLLWHSYLAAPQEPRISTVIFGDDKDGIFWDATLGGRVGLLRYGTAGSSDPSGWQWDLEGAVITRLDLSHAEDVESMDYRFGTQITGAEGPWAWKLGYFHISSHVGDEYLVRNPSFQRTNYVTESWIVGGSYAPTEAARLYAELAYAFSSSGGAKRYQIQTGAEYTPVAKSVRRGAPFAAINLNFRESVDYDVSTTLQLGWALQSPDSKRRLRFGVQYGNGPTSQFSFFERREQILGGGIWFDY